ncbi:MAG: hypothetical protein EON52_16395 [Actinomycetales bacterium]|nr:MAG: hypothetical protein EON52_16395 [Actinomycetales bacterium]
MPELVGARSLTASSSRSDVGARPSLRQDASPWAAFDDDPDTAWRPDAGQGPVAWLDLDLGRRRDVGTVTITLPLDDGAGRSLQVSTEQGVVTVPVESRQAVVDVGTVRHVRISARRSGDEVAIAGVTMQNVQVSRPLRLPATPAAWGAPDDVLLQTETGTNGGCLTVDEVVRCAGAFVERTEDGRTLDRIVPVGAAGSYRAGLRVVPEAGAALDEVLQRGRVASVAVSSQGSSSALGGALATVDGSAESGWVADSDDLDPTLTVRWVQPRRLTAIRLSTAGSTAATPPRAARVVFSDRSEQVAPVVDGVLRLDPVRTSYAEIHLIAGPARLSTDFGGISVGLPVGVGEVSVPGVRGFASSRSEDTVRIPCKDGPTLEVDGVVRRASVRTTVSGLVSGRAVPTSWCDDADTTAWSAGDHRVVPVDGA